MARLVITLEDPAFGRLVYPYVRRVFEPRRWAASWLHVASFPPNDSGGERLVQVRRQLERELHADPLALREAGYDSYVDIRFGQDVANEIARFVSEERADVVVMAVRSQTSPGRWFRRSVAERVWRSVDVPVLVLRCDERRAHADGELSYLGRRAPQSLEQAFESARAAYGSGSDDAARRDVPEPRGRLTDPRIGDASTSWRRS